MTSCDTVMWTNPYTPLTVVLQGISAQEVIKYFFNEETRLEWEGINCSVAINILFSDKI